MEEWTNLQNYKELYYQSVNSLHYLTYIQPKTTFKSLPRTPYQIRFNGTLGTWKTKHYFKHSKRNFKHA